MKYFAPLIICFLCAFSLTAQDRIVTIQGDEIRGKVMIVDTAFIHYVLIDSTADSLAYSKELHKLEKSEVFMIAYANGSKDVFTHNLPEEKTAITNAPKNTLSSSNDYYVQGQLDAEKMFDGTGAFVAGFIGLIPGAIVAVSPPKVMPANVSDPSLISEPTYKRGYKKAASKKKATNAALGYLAGRAATLVFVIGLVLAFE